jgi:diacylglycerol kinase
MRFIHSLRCALTGIRYAAATQAHLRIHCAAVVVVTALGLWLDLAKADWCWLVLAMTLVVSAEVMNTAVEVLADKVCKEPDPLIGHAKDAAAGAVLLAVLGAVVLGVMVLGPPLWRVIISR